MSNICYKRRTLNSVHRCTKQLFGLFRIFNWIIVSLNFIYTQFWQYHKDFVILCRIMHDSFPKCMLSVGRLLTIFLRVM